MALDMNTLLQLGMQMKQFREKSQMQREQFAYKKAQDKLSHTLQVQNAALAQQNYQARIGEIKESKENRKFLRQQKLNEVARQKEQYDALAGAYRDRFSTTDPTTGEVVLGEDYEESVERLFKSGAYEALGQSGTYKQLFGETLGTGSSATERIFDKVVQIQMIPEEQRTEEQAAWYKLGQPLAEKMGMFAPSTPEKEMGYRDQMIMLAMDENQPEHVRELAMQTADALTGKLMKKGGEVVEVTGPMGGKTKQYFPMISLPYDEMLNIAEGNAIRDARTPMKQLIAGVTTAPAKGLDNQMYEVVVQAGNLRGMLGNMKTALLQNSGYYEGTVATAQTFFPEVFGSNPAAEKFYAARPRFMLAMQAFVKGTPSDKDMQTVRKGLPALIGPTGLNIEKWNQTAEELRRIINVAIEDKQAKGAAIPPSVYELHEALNSGEFYMDAHANVPTDDLEGILRGDGK